jgi:hypothetical protein
MTVIPVPRLVYLIFLAILSAVWAIWILSDLVDRGLSKYSTKRVLTYIGSGAVLALLWGLFVGRG